MPNGSRQFSSASLSLAGHNSLMHELKVITAAVELHVNATYYAEHPALKPVYEKNRSFMSGKLFSYYRKVFDLAQGLRYSKTSD